MGIDVYARWDGQTDEEKRTQVTGFSIEAGEAGYLRESYGGDHYATQVLFPECFHYGGTEPYEHVSAAFSREYLSDDGIFLKDYDPAKEFEEKYGISLSADLDTVLEKLGDWWGVEVLPHQSGNVRRTNSKYTPEIGYDPERDEYYRREFDGNRLAASTLEARLPEALRECGRRYPGGDMADKAKASLVKFVELIRRKESEGKNPRIYVSY